MSRIVITKSTPTYITRNLTEEFFDNARNWCCDCEEHSFEYIKRIDLYTDAWSIDETFLVKLTFNKWQRAEKAGRYLAWILGLCEGTQDIDVYRENRTLFLRKLLF